MKQTATLLLFLLLPTFGFSQYKKLTAGIAVAPVYYDLKSHHGFDHEYKNLFSYRVGLDIGFQLSKRSAFATGVYYSTIKYAASYNYIFMDPGDPFIPRDAEITAKYIDLPLTYNFNILVKPKLEYYLSAGFVFSRLISSDDRTTFEDNSIRSSGYLYKSLLSFQGGMGLQYKFSDRVGVKLETHYRQFRKGIDSIMAGRTKAFDATLGVLVTLWSED